MLITFLMAGRSAVAQSFALAHDTVSIVTAGTSLLIFDDSVTNLTTGTANIDWEVIETDFPADWKAASGICDPAGCFSFHDLWPSPSARTFGIGPGSSVFYLSVDFAATTTTGCYYAKVRMDNATIPADTAIATFIICKTALSIKAFSRAPEEISVYPNPATNVISVIYGSGIGVKSISIHNIIGRQLSTYRVTEDTSTTLNIENLPPGMYSVRILNANGNAIATRRFAKQ
jgi:hypothetical protein